VKKFFVPEVVQTSNMDCGPASLKCLLEGFGIPVSYGRLREACQTGIDGTSIDTMETVANQLGLMAEQMMLPVDHLLLPAAKCFPAIVVVTLPNGLTHFVVVWRRVGPMLQVMDPAVGRRWIRHTAFEREIYRHGMAVSAADWREFACSSDFQIALRQRLLRLGISRRDVTTLVNTASQKLHWRSAAALDASTRLMTSLVESGGVRSRDCVTLVTRFCEEPELIPDRYWSVRPGPIDSEGGEQVLMRGAVLVRVRGRRKADRVPENGKIGLDAELGAAVRERPLSPGRELVRALWHSGALGAGLLLTALIAAAGGTLFEAMLFRGLFDVTAELGLAGQRIGAAAAVLLFSLALLLLEVPSFAAGARLGRQIELRLRTAFLEKIPKLGDRYFQSRLTSDMAERSHATQRLRHLPDQVRQLLRSIFELLATAAGIAWLEPSATALVSLIAASALIPAFTTQSVLAERDLRARSHAGGLTRFYLDAMLGLMAIRAHGAERSVRREHEKLLGEWVHAALRLQRAVVSLEALQLACMFGLVALLLLARPLHGADIGRVLLVVYWALNLPVLGQDIATLARQYPYYRNVTLRLLDPLGAPEEVAFQERADAAAPSGPPAIEFRNVSARVSGHTILDQINFRIEPGSHVAIVGTSGAGKSSLVGILLGWLKPAEGTVLVDEAPLNCERLRLSTAWVDPAVQLWNRSLLANLSYGSTAHASQMGGIIDSVLLRHILETLPDGLQTKLGEGGGLVSGGEGQRVRLGRAMLREGTRLVILDEPFRGLDREKRRELLARAREFWRGCTLLCITHDIAETQSFERVLVIEGGRVAEDILPTAVEEDPDSRYAQLLQAEKETHSALWAAGFWLRAHVHAGRIIEELPKQAEETRLGSEVA
jgi:ATP-binding cassette subfamily B protein